MTPFAWDENKDEKDKEIYFINRQMNMCFLYYIYIYIIFLSLLKYVFTSKPNLYIWAGLRKTSLVPITPNKISIYTKHSGVGFGGFAHPNE